MAVGAVWRSVRGFRKRLETTGVTGQALQWSASSWPGVSLATTTCYYGSSTVSSAFPPVSSLTSTATFTDNAVGDTTTYPPMTASLPGSGPHTLTLYGFALCDFGSVVTLTGVGETFYTVIAQSDPGQLPGKSATLIVEYSADSTNGLDGTWTNIATHNTTVTAIPVTYSDSVASVSARWVRGRYTIIYSSAIGISMDFRASDFRAYAFATAPMNVPQNLTADFCSEFGTELTLSWDAVTGLEGIRVYRDGIAYLSIFLESATSVTLTSQEPAVSHCWTVTSFSGLLESDQSASTCGFPNYPPVGTLTVTPSKCGRFHIIDYASTGYVVSGTLVYVGENDMAGDPVFYPNQTDTLVTIVNEDLPSGEYTYTLRAHEVGFPQMYELAISNTCGDDDDTVTVGPEYTGTEDCSTDYSGTPSCATSYTGTPTCTTSWS